MFKVKYVDYIMMLVRLYLNLIVSLFQHKSEVSETVSITTYPDPEAAGGTARADAGAAAESAVDFEEGFLGGCFGSDFMYLTFQI